MNRTRRNAILGVGLGVAVGLFSVFPMFFQQRQAHNFSQQEGPLSPNLVGRGAFVNAGSRDVGADPNWKTVNGRRVNVSPDVLSSISDEELEEFKRLRSGEIKKVK